MNIADFAVIHFALAQADAPTTAPQQAETSTQIVTTAPTTGPTTQPAPQKPWWASDFMPLILGLLVLYFFVFRSKSKKEKSRVQMLNALKRGDRIQTIGGILGTVVDAREDEVVVKVDETSNTKITFSRNAIHRVVEEDKK